MIPTSIAHMIREGWRFEWEPKTKFLGAYHPRGGKISVLEIRDPRFADIGTWIVSEIEKGRD